MARSEAVLPKALEGFSRPHDRTGHTSSRSWYLVLVILLSSGCGSPDAASPAVVVRDSAGVTIVENTESSRPSGIGWSIAPESPLEIGSGEGAPEYQFTRIVGVRRLRDGTLVVADGGSLQLRFYGAGGEYIRSVGRAGGGPGEFRYLGGFTVVEDSIYVFDGGQRRLSVFDPAGELVRSMTITPPEGGSPATLYMHIAEGMTRSGQILLLPSGSTGIIEPRGSFWHPSGYPLLYDRSGEPLDTIGETMGSDYFSTAEFSMVPPFARWSRAAFGSDHLYMTDGGDFEVRVYPLSRSPTTIIRLDRPERPVTSDWVERHRERLLAGVPPDGRDAAAQMLSGVPHREHLPWISDLKVDDAGFLWVAQYTLEWEPDVVWTIFDTEGRLAGSLTLPSALRVHQIGEDFIVGAWRDELGVESVRQYTLVRG